MRRGRSFIIFKLRWCDIREGVIDIEFGDWLIFSFLFNECCCVSDIFRFDFFICVIKIVLYVYVVYIFRWIIMKINDIVCMKVSKYNIIIILYITYSIVYL